MALMLFECWKLGCRSEGCMDQPDMVYRRVLEAAMRCPTCSCTDMSGEKYVSCAVLIVAMHSCVGCVATLKNCCV